MSRVRPYRIILHNVDLSILPASVIPPQLFVKSLFKTAPGTQAPRHPTTVPLPSNSLARWRCRTIKKWPRLEFSMVVAETRPTEEIWVAVKIKRRINCRIPSRSATHILLKCATPPKECYSQVGRSRITSSQNGASCEKKHHRASPRVFRTSVLYVSRPLV